MQADDAPEAPPPTILNGKSKKTFTENLQNKIEIFQDKTKMAASSRENVTLFCQWRRG